MNRDFLWAATEEKEKTWQGAYTVERHEDFLYPRR
jgi:hypothetical protein